MYILEIDGPQHFKQIPRREKVEAIRKRDFYKMCKAIKNLNKQCEVYISSDLEKYAEFHKEMLDYLKNNMQSI